MIYQFLRYIENRNVRRVAGIVAIVLFIPLVILALLVGTALHLFSGLKGFCEDLYDTITNDIPRVFKDFILVARTGQEI